MTEYWVDGPGSEFPPGHRRCSPRPSPARTATAWTRTSRCSSPSATRCWTRASASWTRSTSTTSGGRSPPSGTSTRARRSTTHGGGRASPTATSGRALDPYQAPNVVTPAFPEYVSGHSTFSAAGASILTSFTTSDIFDAYVTISARTRRHSWSKIEPGTPASPVTLSWPTFTAAADRGRPLAPLRRHPLLERRLPRPDAG